MSHILLTAKEVHPRRENATFRCWWRGSSYAFIRPHFTTVPYCDLCVWCRWDAQQGDICGIWWLVPIKVCYSRWINTPWRWSTPLWVTLLSSMVPELQPLFPCKLSSLANEINFNNKNISDEKRDQVYWYATCYRSQQFTYNDSWMNQIWYWHQGETLQYMQRQIDG